MSTVIASDIPPSVGIQKVEEFFSFCGKIKSIKPVKSGSLTAYEIDFESPKALSTAALLDNAELDGATIQVHVPGTGNVEYGDFKDEAPAYREVNGPQCTPTTTAGSDADNKIQYNSSAVTHTGDERYDQVTQEEKPKYAIFAQLLASGYHLSDKVIDRGLAVDNEKGYSKKAKSFLTQIDDKYIGTQKPDTFAGKLRNQSLDKWHSSGYGDKFKEYLNRAASTPYGSKVQSLYELVCKEAKDIHQEALRLKQLKGGSQGAPSSQGTHSSQGAPSSQAAHSSEGSQIPPESPPLYSESTTQPSAGTHLAGDTAPPKLEKS